MRTGEMESEVLADQGGMVIVRHRVPAGFADGTAAEYAAGDAFHVDGGHLVDVLVDAELIELTRSEEYRRKAEHLASGHR